MTKHAKFSASQSSQWLNCHGVMGMKALAPPETSSEAANEGTAAHELLEQCLSQGLDAYEKLGDTVTIKLDDGGTQDYIVDDDMADAVQICIDLVNSYKGKYPHAEAVYEEKVNISSLCGSDMFGTVDVKLSIAFDRLIVIDYKHGRGIPVQIKNNTQLRYYALGSALHDDFEFDEVELVIVQPRCHKVPDIQTEVISIDELKEWAKTFKEGRDRAEKAGNEIVEAGEPIEAHLKAGSWCTFCPAKTMCPAQYNQMVELAQIDFNDGEIEMADPLKIDPDKRAKILDHGDAIKKFIDAVHSEAHADAERGEKIPGWKLVNKVARAKFLDDDDTVIKKLVKAKFKKADITRTSLETLGKLRKICGKDVIESMTHKPITGTTLVPEGDKREPVKPSIESDFADD